MTNAEAAKHFASLPPNEDAEIVLVNGDTATAEVLSVDEPGRWLGELEEDERERCSKELATTFMKW